MTWRHIFRIILPLTLLSLASTAPLSSLGPRDISADLLANLNLYSQYSAAAYCSNNNNSPGTKLTCPTSNCPLVQAANTTTTSEFQHTPLTDDTGYLALSLSGDQIILSFRGSVSIQNFISDIEFPFTASPTCPGCYVHEGFLAAWNEVRPTVMSALAAATAAHPSYSFVITGHSLGGALASLAAADLRQNGHPAALYTFGSPRVGNAAWASFVTAQPGGNYRVTHTDDPVPRLPPLIAGFEHISPEYWIENGEDTVAASGIEVLQGEINLLGNTGTLGFDVDAHLHYFGPISECGPGLFSYKA